MYMRMKRQIVAMARHIVFAAILVPVSFVGLIKFGIIPGGGVNPGPLRSSWISAGVRLDITVAAL